MAARNYKNNVSVVTIPGSTTNATNPIAVSDASSYPTSFPYTAVIDAGLSTAEIVLVTAAAGNNLTVTRGYDGTAAQSHAAAATFQHVAVKADYAEANAHVNATQNVHGLGASSSVVGTTDIQTLTNKTLTSPAINTPTINNGGVLTLPTSADTLIGRATTDTLTNKTLNGAVLDAASTHGGVSGTILATMPRGRVASASLNASVAFASAVESAVTGLSDISVTAIAGRRYKVTVSLVDVLGVVSNATAIRLRDGGASAPTTASTLLHEGTAANSPETVGYAVELSGLSAGTHRLGLFNLAASNGVTIGSATTGRISSIIIEDIGV